MRVAFLAGVLSLAAACGVQAVIDGYRASTPGYLECRSIVDQHSNDEDFAHRACLGK